MQVFLHCFSASGKSYTKKTVKMFPFTGFSNFLDIKIERLLPFLYQLFYILYCSIVQIFIKNRFNLVPQKRLFWAYF